MVAEKNEKGVIIEPKGFLIGDLTQLRIVFEDGRWVDRKIPHDKLHVTLAALFETGIPTTDEKNFPGIEVWLPPPKIACIVVCKDEKSFSRYTEAPSLTRAAIERGFILREEAKMMKDAGR